MSNLAFWMINPAVIAFIVLLCLVPSMDRNIGLMIFFLFSPVMAIAFLPKFVAKGRKISALAYAFGAVLFLAMPGLTLNLWGKLFLFILLLAAIPRVLAELGATEIIRIRRVAVWSAVIALALLTVIGFIHGQTPSASRLETLTYVAVASACVLSAISPIRIFADESLFPILSILGFIAGLMLFLVIRPINLDIWGKLLAIAWMTAAFSRTYAEASDIFGWNRKHK